MNSAVEELGLNNNSELFEQIGLGERLAPLTARFLLGVGSEPLIVAITTAIAKWFKGRELAFAFAVYASVFVFHLYLIWLRSAAAYVS